MTEREILKRLKQAGWKITEGKGHHMATSLQHPGVKIPIPRHKGDIPTGTATRYLSKQG